MQITNTLKQMLYSTLIALTIVGCGGGGGTPPNPTTTYTLTYTAATGGTLTGNVNQTVNQGTDGSIVTAVANVGYHFLEWSDGVTSASRQETNVQSNITLIARFTQDVSTTYTLTYTAGTGGTLTGNAIQTVNASTDGTVVTAVAETGYRFLSWSDGSLSATRQDRAIQSDITVRANFAKDQAHTYQLRYSAEMHGSVFGNTIQSKEAGTDSAPVTAIADVGYLFDRWSDGLVSATRHETDIQEDKNLIARFIIDPNAPTTRINVTCDGTDDDIEINQALSDIATAGGGTVHLATGICIISSPIQISGDNSIIEGEGIDQTIIKLKDEAGWVTMDENSTILRSDKEYLMHMVAPASKNIIIRNLSIDGNKQNQHLTNPSTNEISLVPDGMGYYDVIGIYPTTAQGILAENIHIDHVYVYEANSDAFIIHNAKNIKVEHCKTLNIGHSATYSLDPLYMIIEDNNFTINANSGVRWYDGNHIIVRNNHLQGDAEKTGNSNFCIEVTSGQTSRILDDVVIEHNEMKYVAGAAIAIDAKTPAQATGMIIRNNSIYQCSAIGTWVTNRERGAINIKNFTNTLIENNTIVNCIGGGIRLGGNAGFNDEWDEVKGLTATIRNNIITHTILDEDKGIVVDAYGIDIGAGNSAECTYNNLWKNHSGDYHGCTPGIGSISEDPQFTYLELGTSFSTTHGRADFHLKSKTGRWDPATQTWKIDPTESSSINAGSPTSDASQEIGAGSTRINMGMYGNSAEASQGIQSPPIAEAGLDQYLRADESAVVYVGLDASLSSDDGSITDYIWRISGLQVAQGERATIPLSVGIHTIELTVTDNDGLETQDRLLVRVNPKGTNINPVADAGEDQTLTDIADIGSVRTLLSSMASYDEDGIILYYQWMENGTTLSTEANPALNLTVGTHLIDLTVTDNEGGTHTDTITVTIKPKKDYALTFNDGAITDEYVTIENLYFPTDFTIEMWVKPLASSGDLDALITMGEDGQQLVLKNMQPAWGTAESARASDEIPIGSWTHLAFVVSDQTLQALYINGVSSPLMGDGNITRPRGYMGVAALYLDTASSLNFKGVFDEIRIWKVARTAQEINDNKDIELIGTEADLAAYFNFNEGSGNKLEDSTGTYSGTLSESMGAENWVEGAITP